ncbi:MAG: spore maturation protein CgeB, partial [Myxococcales bacterium]|nr:spore maturation protein CgeB [Myxococcales bacterium]
MLRANLEALARRDPELVTRIGWPVDNRQVTSDAGGALLYQVQQTRHRLTLTPETVAAALAPAPTEGELFVFGVGSGELVEALRLARPKANITAWDRDPWLLRLALQRHDWTEALTSGRLRLQLGTDLVAHAAASDGLIGPGVVLHPLLGAVYQNERWLLEAGAARRPLVALGAGGLFTDDLASALRGEGYAVYTLDIHRLSEEELARSLRVLAPAFLAAINYTEGLAEFAAAHGCKLVVWEIDPATSALPPCRASTDGVRVFTYRQANVAAFRAAGFSHVTYLPLAADPGRRLPVALSSDERARYGAPVAFVGSSLAPQKEGFRQAFVAAFSTAVSEAGMSLL